MKTLFVLVFLGLCCSATLFAAEQSKKTASLSEHGIKEAAEYSAARRGLGLLVIQHGKTLWEQYPNGSSRDEPHRIYSGTKIFWNLAALYAQEKGLLRLDERVSDTIPEWREDRSKSRVTIQQLMDFTSGLEPTPSLHGDGLSNRDAIAIKRPIVASPGTAFLYGPASLQVFHELLRRKLESHGESPTHYLERHVLSPLGLGAQRYLPDHAGNPLLASGFKLTARDWSRVGKMMLHGGSPVVSAQSFEQCCRGGSPNGAFSMGVWNNHNAAHSGAREFDIEDMLELKWQQQSWRNTCICRDAPSDLIACVGSGYQRLFVIPSMDLIIVRQGVNAKFSDGQFLRLILGK